MNEPTRLLDTAPDGLGATLLRAGRDVDASAARARKAALLGGAAAGTALGVATATGSAKPLGVWLAAKWVLVGALGATTLITATTLLSTADADEPRATAPLAAAAPPTAVLQAQAPVAETASLPALPPVEAAPLAPPPAAVSPPSSSVDGERSPGSAAPQALAESAGDSPAPTNPASALAAELALLRQARAAVGAGRAAEALAALDAHRRLGTTHLGEEAEVLRVEVMALSGDRAGASRRAAELLARRPESPYAARLRALAGTNP